MTISVMHAALLGQSRFGNDQYTKVLIHFDGTDGSTTITDTSIGGSVKTWTAAGNGQIDTADSKFGGSSFLSDGTGDYISTPDHSDFSVGSGDFTYDFWIKRADTGTRRGICGQVNGSGAAGGGLEFEYNSSNQARATIYYNSGANAVTETGATLTDTASWHHIAVIRNGNTLYIATDGTLSAGTSVSGVTADDATGVFHIGRLGLFGNTWNSHIDEFRISVGIARWTANFTPPTFPYV